MWCLQDEQFCHDLDYILLSFVGLIRQVSSLDQPKCLRIYYGRSDKIMHDRARVYAIDVGDTIEMSTSLNQTELLPKLL